MLKEGYCEQFRHAKASVRVGDRESESGWRLGQEDILAVIRSQENWKCKARQQPALCSSLLFACSSIYYL